MHRLHDRAPETRTARPHVVELPSAPRDLANEVLPRLRASWHRPADLEQHAAALKVSVASLQALLAFAEGNLLHVPMFDHERHIVGVRVRRVDGTKWAWPGGREGVFWPMPGADGPLLLPEGPTSSAALLDLGCAVLGRPCATPGTLAMSALRELTRGRDVVLVAENDLKPDGRWPGRDGAEYSSRVLLLSAASVRIVFPPSEHKDARDAIRAGWSRPNIEAAIDAAQPIGIWVEVRR